MKATMRRIASVAFVVVVVGGGEGVRPRSAPPAVVDAFVPPEVSFRSSSSTIVGRRRRSGFLSSSSSSSSDAADAEKERGDAVVVGAADPSRSSFLRTVFAASAGFLLTFVPPSPSLALVKGNAPPPKKSSSSSSDEKKCTNVEECQEMAERLASEKEAALKAEATPPKIAPGGTRYRDLSEGGSGGRAAKEGDDVTIRYKVLKLGKRSYDGISGEGTVVFSRGYGLEDDEPKPGVQSFSFRLGDPTVISALNDALPGMTPDSVRRIAVLPQMGWETPTAMCDGGPGGKGAGGELKTDYVIVPTATMVSTESCFDTSKKPFPTSYAEKRRMAQRFDQSLIMEVELVSVN